MRKHPYLTGLATAAVAALALAAPDAQAEPLTAFNFGSNSDITFSPGGTFLFGDDAPGAIDDFNITSQTGGTGTLVGLSGEINGAFSFSNPAGSSTAPVTTTGGSLLISDGAGGTISAPLNLTLIGEGAPGFENTGSISGMADFTGSTYGGENTDLLALVGQAPGSEGPAIITFQTVEGVIELDTVFAQGGNFSYSGSIGTPFTEGEVPEPATLGLIGAGLLGLGMIGRRRKTAA